MFIQKISLLVPLVFLQYCSSIFIRPDFIRPSNITSGPDGSYDINYNHKVEVVWDRKFLGKFRRGRFGLINRNHFDVNVWKFRHDIVFYSDLAPRKLYSESWNRFKVPRRDNLVPEVDYFYQYQCEYDVHDEWHLWFGLQGDNYTATLTVDIKPKDTGEFVALISNNNTDFKILKTHETVDVSTPIVRLTNDTDFTNLKTHETVGVSTPTVGLTNTTQTT